MTDDERKAADYDRLEADAVAVALKLIDVAAMLRKVSAERDAAIARSASLESALSELADLMDDVRAGKRSPGTAVPQHARRVLDRYSIEPRGDVIEVIG